MSDPTTELEQVRAQLAQREQECINLRAALAQRQQQLLDVSMLSTDLLRSELTTKNAQLQQASAGLDAASKWIAKEEEAKKQRAAAPFGAGSIPQR